MHRAQRMFWILTWVYKLTGLDWIDLVDVDGYYINPNALIPSSSSSTLTHPIHPQSSIPRSFDPTTKQEARSKKQNVPENLRRNPLSHPHHPNPAHTHKTNPNGSRRPTPLQHALPNRPAAPRHHSSRSPGLLQPPRAQLHQGHRPDQRTCRQ